MTDTDAHGNSHEDGIAVTFRGGREIRLTFADMASPERMRAAVYAQIGHEIPHHSPEQHEQVVRALMQLATLGELEKRQMQQRKRDARARQRRRGRKR
jgi:hypothetical protein